MQNKIGNQQRMKILVTGADGFIGSHLTEGLVRLGYKVRAFFKDCPRMDLTAAQSLSQRLINIPSSSGLVSVAP